MMREGSLAYVTVASVDVERTAHVLSVHFGLPRSLHLPDAKAPPIPLYAVGETALAVVPIGDPFINGDTRPGVHHVVFASEDPESAAAQAATRLDCKVATAEPGLDGATRFALPPAATEGVKVYFSKPVSMDRSRGGCRHVERIDHLGIVSADTQRAIDVFHRRLGLTLESQQVDVETLLPFESFTSDKYGIVQHNREPVFCGGVRSAFITAGDCELEFLQDYSPLGPGEIDPQQAGTTRQDRGAIARFLASRGPGLAHIAFKTPSIADALAEAKTAGCELIDRVGRAGGRRSQIAFIHPRGMGGMLFHFVQRD